MSPTHPLDSNKLPTRIKSKRDALQFRTIPITFHTDPDTATRLTALASAAGVEISWYLWRLISDAYIDYVLIQSEDT